MKIIIALGINIKVSRTVDDDEMSFGYKYHNVKRISSIQ